LVLISINGGSLTTFVRLHFGQRYCHWVLFCEPPTRTLTMFSPLQSGLVHLGFPIAAFYLQLVSYSRVSPFTRSSEQKTSAMLDFHGHNRISETMGHIAGSIHVLPAMSVYFQARYDHHVWQSENRLRGCLAQKTGLRILGRDAVWFETKNHA